MATNLLEAPVAKLQSVLNPPAPWGFVARHLVSLLKSYSTGLSFEAAADHISLAWKQHCKDTHSRSRVLTATVTHVGHGPPEVWLVRLPDTTELAVYAHSNYLGTVTPGTIVSFPTDIVVEPASAQGVVSEQVRLVRRALRGASSAPFDATHDVQTSTTKADGNISQSPVDVMKFAVRRAQPQHAATPSQVVDPADPGGTVTRIILPTSNILFDLDSVSLAVLGLSEPPRAFTLQRVWNERSLTPSWIYASIVEVKRDGERAVRLQDLPTKNSDDQPSVLWRVPQELEGIVDILEPGFHVLLRNPLVQPTADSFDVHSGPHTTCFYEKKVNTKRLVTPGRPARQDITNAGTGPREMKRRRIEPDLSKNTKVIGTEQVSDIVNPEGQSEFVTHARVIGEPKREKSYLSVVPCQHGITVTVVGLKMARRAAQVTAGDEILLQGMKWVSSSSCNEGRTPSGWIAGSIDNISNMTGTLFTPLTRCIIPLRSCFFPDTNAAQTSSRTAHVLVRVRNAIPDSGRRELIISIVDANLESNSSRAQVSRPNINRGDTDDNRYSKKQVDVGNREYDVKVRESCFESLFWTPAKSFWEDEMSEILVRCLPRLRAETWLMTLILYPSKERRLPGICACVSHKL